MHMTNHEGKILRLFLKSKGIKQDDFANENGISRATLINYMNLSVLPAEFKQMIRQKGHIVDFAGQVKDTTPETYGEFIELYRKLVKQLEERIEVQEKYIAVLEDNAARAKAKA